MFSPLNWVLNEIDTGILICDTHHTILYHNETLHRLLPINTSIQENYIGKNIQEMLPVFFSALVSSQYWQEFILEQLQADKIAQNILLDLCNEEKLILNIRAVHKENNKHYIWTFRYAQDLIKNINKSLPVHSFLKEILDKLPADLVIFSPDHRYIYVNENAIKNKQYRDWIIGKNDTEYYKYRNIQNNFSEERKKQFEKVINQKIPAEFHEDYNFPDGTFICKLRRLHPVYNPAGVLQYIIGYGFDITELRMAESELIRAKQLAEASSEAKETFIANVSHELRTPLNGIAGIVELLLQSELNTEQKHWTKLLYDSTDNLKSLVNELLDMARINRGEIEICNKLFSIKNTLSPIAETFKIQANAKKLQWEDNIDTLTDYICQGDKLRLTQILNNLLSNAVKFTSKGKIIFNIYLHVNPDNSLLLDARVEDQGEGIDIQNQEIIFEPFVKLQSEVSLQQSGTGLGLPITRKLVKLLHGNLTLRSTPGKGSTFTTHIPFVLANHLHHHTHVLPEASSYPLRILVVEDHPVNRFLIELQLRHATDLLITAENGAEALEYVMNHDFNILILDINLPDIQGEELLGKIRKMTRYKETPAIALTANANPEFIKKTLETGFDGFLSKPYSAPELLSLINKIGSFSNSLSKKNN